MGANEQSPQLNWMTNPETFQTAVLDKWLDVALESKKHDVDTTSNLGRLGLKTPAQIKRFLLSPAGQSVQSELAAEASFHLNMENRQKLDLQESLVIAHRIKALIFQWLLVEKGHAAQQLNELIIEQNEKAIKNSADIAKSAQPGTATSGFSHSLQKALQQFDNTITGHEAKQRELIQRETNLNEQHESLEQHKNQIHNKYALYEDRLMNFLQSTDQYQTVELDEQIMQLEIETQQNQQEMERLSAESNSQAAAQVEPKLRAGIEQLSRLYSQRDRILSQKIDELNEQLQAKADEIYSCLENDDEDKARELIQEQNALNLQIGCLQDIRTKHKEQKIFVDAQGKPCSYQQADYIISSAQKIVEKDGVHYLLKKGIELDDLDEVEQKEAQHQFEHSKHQIMSVKRAVYHVKSQEKEVNIEQIATVVQKIQETRTEKLLLENQLNLLQAARANAIASQEQQDNTQMEAPRPTPSISSSGKPHAPLSAQALKAYSAYNKFRDHLFFANQNNPVTPIELENISDRIADATTKKAVKTYLRQFMEIAELPRKTPIPHQTMVSLLENLDRYVGNAYKKHFALQSPMELAKAPKPSPAAPAPSPFANTPFNPKPGR